MKSSLVSLMLITLSLLLSPASPAGDALADAMSRAPIKNFLSEGFGSLNAKAPAETKEFGRLVGLWHVETEMASGSGEFVPMAPGLWAWKYALDGFAVSDLWYQSAENLPSYMANLGRDYLLTANRVYAVAEHRWHVAWMANGAGSVMGADVGTFTAQLVDGELVMSSGPGSFGLQRVIFSEFSDDSFRWRSDYSQDDGKTWTTVMRMRAKRLEK